ncbi:Uncharacterised protein [Acinetobacter baumannii]|nr:Uncharacterised protein [Acinetobacter baumannii]
MHYVNVGSLLLLLHSHEPVKFSLIFSYQPAVEASPNQNLLLELILFE